MTRTQANGGTPHLFSAAIACGFAALILLAGRTLAIYLEQRAVPSVAPKIFTLKNQGLAFQRAAARAQDVLPLYGSSELMIPPIPERAADFFCTAPTGFQVSPVGKLGTTPLIILQKIGALGSDLHGKKLAISVSVIWRQVGTFRYEGNFSLFAASEMIFGSALDFDLKRDIALRMLHYPHTLERSPLLAFALERLASGTWIDRAVFHVLWPLGKTQNMILDFQDHFAALDYILHRKNSGPPSHPETLDWSKLIADAERKVPAKEEDKKASGFDEQVAPGQGDRSFLNRVNRMKPGPGWVDLELLLRVLAKIGARPLLLSAPVAGLSYEHREGVSRAAREVFYQNLRALAERYNSALAEFEEHDTDPTFLDPNDEAHITAKGWMYYNHALDDFFHERIPGTQ